MDLEITQEKAAMLYPVLPLRDIVVFPHMIVPLFVGREKSIYSLEEAMNGSKQILLAKQKDPAQEMPEADDIYEVGTLANILQLLKLPDGTVKVLIESVSRAKANKYIEHPFYHQAEVEILEEPEEDRVEVLALQRFLLSTFENYAKLKKISNDVLSAVNQIEDPSRLMDTIASHLNIKLVEKQEILQLLSLVKRAKKIIALMDAEVSVLEVEKRIRSRVKRQMEKTQREYYLHEQMKAIQKELGDRDNVVDELSELSDRIKATKLSKEAKQRAESELKKLRSMPAMSSEATVVRNYLDWLLSLPWDKKSKIKQDLSFAENLLEQDHFGLDEVKERIIEYLAVQSRSKKLKGPIICLVGPPGVGKTSLARSIAKATGREYVRMALGGVRDESEIRGHRRTYIGSMPGKIIQSMKKAKRGNPLFLLDEIDKIGQDYRGDPASALLEVLDPEQNANFTDHYLEVEYDLSDVMFIATANTLNIPSPLMDRMEIIRLSGYTETEKLEIAKRHLLPKVMEHHALSAEEFAITEEALRQIVRYYTREAGVRELERQLMKIGRKAVTQLIKKQASSVHVDEKNLQEYLGVVRYRRNEVEEKSQIGLVTGLAWTEVGGELLSIEAVLMPGKGKMTVTGNLRDVMKESISAAASYVRSHSLEFGIKNELFEKYDIHVHVPEGATPKDGPSAGIAMVSAIVSVLTGIPIHKHVAMTGEVTLRGRVLPIGGLKEKLLAALRGGIKKVLIPEANAKDVVELPEEVKNNLEIVPVSWVGEVLEHSLQKSFRPVEPLQHPDTVEAARFSSEVDASVVVPH